MITGTFFFHETARHKKEFAFSPGDLVDEIEQQHAPSKTSLKWIKLARFGDLVTAKGSLRHNKNVLAVSGVEADYDQEKILFDDAVGKLEEAGIEAIAYTSPSHKEDKPRWRVLAPLSKEYPPEERAKFLARLNGLFAGALGAESFTLSQSYYFGYVGNGAQAPATHRAKYIQGDFIDLRSDLDEGAIGKNGKTRKDGNTYENYGEDNSERLDFKAAVTEIVSGGDYHVPMRRIIASMIARGTEELVVRDMAIGLFRAACMQRPDLHGREKEIPPIIDWTYEQEEKKQQPQPQTTSPQAKPTLPPDISIDDFYAYLPKHQYLYVPTQTLWPPATISSRLAKIGGTKPTRWLDKNKAISQIIWAPGEPGIILNKHLIEGGWIEKSGAIVFNQYREPPLLNGDPALAGPWLNLVKKIYPRPEEHEHIIRALAFKLQHPEIKINHALVLGGATRIGKDTILIPIRRALGAWNVREAKPTEIMGNFNPFMRSIILIINESRDLGEVKKYQFYDHMKDVIATPPEVYPVNDKHEKTTHVLNVCLVIMTTNYRTDGLYLPADDARHFPIWSDLAKEDHKPEFFKNHYAWLKNSGVAHVAAFLRSLDVSDFEPGEHPPQTEMLREIVDASIPQEVLWIRDIMEDAQWTPAVFILESLISRASKNEELKKWLENPGNRKVIPHRLEAVGYVRVRNPKHGEGRWKINEKFQNVYGNKRLKLEILLREAGGLR